MGMVKTGVGLAVEILSSEDSSQGSFEGVSFCADDAGDAFK